MKGGKAIDSGGFGCIFKPNITCKDNSNYKSDNMISKLMKKKYVEKEINEILKIKNIISKIIPNYKKYFLLDNIYSCNPSKLLSDDLNNFNNKCNQIIDYNITSKNINENLDSLAIINMPYGGISLTEYFKKILLNQNTFNYNFSKINNLLIELLVKAIVPLNNNGVSHFDLKSSNILYNNNELKIIDWGLSHKHNNILPKKFEQHPIQYNIPFSAILLDDISLEYIEKFYKQFNKVNNINKNYINKILAINLLHNTQKIYGIAHSDIISYQIIRKLYNYFDGDIIYSDETNKIHNLSKDKYISSIFFVNIISDYLAAILDKYVKYGKFNRQLYFSEIYSKNADVWGFIMTYYKLINYKHFQDIILKHNLFNSILSIIFKYCYSTTYAVIPIPIYELVEDLQDLNINLGYFDVYSYSENKKDIPIKSLQKTINEPIINKFKNKFKFTKKKHKSISKSKYKSTQKIIKLVGKRCPKGYTRHKLDNTLCVKINK